MQEGTPDTRERKSLVNEWLDPVCGMPVAKDTPHRLRLGDVEYRFCSAHCQERFARHPEAFADRDHETKRGGERG